LVSWAANFWVQVGKKVSESGDGELWENFCERVRITAPPTDLTGI